MFGKTSTLSDTWRSVCGSVLVVCCICVVFVLASATMLRAAQAEGGISQPTVEVFQFNKTPLSEILQMISEMTGQNVVATPEIQNMPISLFLKNITPILALEVICKTYNLWFTEQDKVIRVMKVEEYGRELTLRRDEQTRVFNLKYASCFTVGEAIQNVFGTRIELTNPEQTESYGHVGTDEFPEIGESVDAQLTDTEADENAHDYDEREEGITELAGVKMDKEDLGRMARLLREGSEFTPEMLLERQIGQARALMTIFPRNNSVIVRSVDSNLLAEVGHLIEQIDTPTRELFLEVKILGVTLEDGMESFFDIDFLPFMRTGTSLSLAARAASLTQSPPSFAFSFINDVIGLRLELLETEGRVTELSTPMMLVANNAAGRFFQGMEIAIREGYSVTQPQFNADGAQISPGTVSTTYSREDIGFTLEIAPSINEDRSVTMQSRKGGTLADTLVTFPNLQEVATGVVDVGNYPYVPEWTAGRYYYEARPALLMMNAAYVKVDVSGGATPEYEYYRYVYDTPAMNKTPDATSAYWVEDDTFAGQDWVPDYDGSTEYSKNMKTPWRYFQDVGIGAGWRGPYTSNNTTSLSDAWGNEITIKPDKQGVEIRSFGPDKTADTVDDIVEYISRSEYEVPGKVIVEPTSLTLALNDYVSVYMVFNGDVAFFDVAPSTTGTATNPSEFKFGTVDRATMTPPTGWSPSTPSTPQTAIPPMSDPMTIDVTSMDDTLWLPVGRVTAVFRQTSAAPDYVAPTVAGHQYYKTFVIHPRTSPDLTLGD